MANEDTRPVDERNTRGFPGGSTPLPRISQPRSASPDVMFVESAFYREPREPWPVATPVEDTGFGQYNSTASLFDPDLDPVDDAVEGDPYSVLGMTGEDTWEDISRAHRLLVSELHPDRYVGADDVVRDAAERRVRDVNEAFSGIRRERANRGR